MKSINEKLFNIIWNTYFDKELLSRYNFMSFIKNIFIKNKLTVNCNNCNKPCFDTCYTITFRERIRQYGQSISYHYFIV